MISIRMLQNYDIIVQTVNCFLLPGWENDDFKIQFSTQSHICLPTLVFVQTKLHKNRNVQRKIILKSSLAITNNKNKINQIKQKIFETIS